MNITDNINNIARALGCPEESLSVVWEKMQNNALALSYKSLVHQVAGAMWDSNIAVTNIDEVLESRL